MLLNLFQFSTTSSNIFFFFCDLHSIFNVTVSVPNETIRNNITVWLRLHTGRHSVNCVSCMLLMNLIFVPGHLHCSLIIKKYSIIWLERRHFFFSSLVSLSGSHSVVVTKGKETRNLYIISNIESLFI